jgi:hypothetical protein
VAVFLPDARLEHPHPVPAISLPVLLVAVRQIRGARQTLAVPLQVQRIQAFRLDRRPALLGRCGLDAWAAVRLEAETDDHLAPQDPADAAFRRSDDSVGVLPEQGEEPYRWDAVRFAA